MNRRMIIVGALVLLPVAAAAAYPDVPGDHRSAIAIDTLQAAGIMRGYPDGSFGPDITLNRAELMKLLVESSGEQPDPEYYADCFPDVRTEWFAPFVCYAAEQEWVSGYPDGTFQPGRPVNTAEALKMLTESKGYPIAIPDPAAGTAPFGTGAWYAPYLATAATQGIVEPRVLRTIWPDAPLPRSRAAEFLYSSLLRDGYHHAVVANDACAASGMTTITLAYSRKDDRTDTSLAAAYADGSTCALSTQFNPYRTATSGIDDLLAPLLLPDPRLTETENGFTLPLTSDGRAYFVHSILEPYVNAEDGALWEFRAGSGTLTRIPLNVSRPYVVSPDLRHVAFVRGVSPNVSRLVYAELATGKSAAVTELKGPQSFFIYASSGSSVGGFSFGTGNTLTYSVYDSNQATELEPGIVQYAKLREQTVDLATLTLKP